MNRPLIWAVLENIATVSAMAAVFIFAEGGWKLLGLTLILNFNTYKGPVR